MRHALCAILMLLLTAGGCVRLPIDPLTEATTSDELVQHVRFLSSRRLSGRRPRTGGSQWAQRYITDRFEACGLEPFGDAEGYKQPFVIGTNVVGVLPGADPAAGDEYVLVSAHYDHLGMWAAKRYPGAADNATGVAVMLEIAEQLALSQTRPKRPIVFAAFDAEERGLYGAFAFSCRRDFSPDKLAAVVNLDTLGRAGFNVLDNTVLAFGTERYPQLRKRVVDAGRRADLRVLPLNRDLVGPRSDHAAFEDYGKPWVFLTVGEYPEYHEPTDTWDKLDYVALTRTAACVLETVDALANDSRIESPVTPAAGDRQELAAIETVLLDVIEEPARAGVSLAQLRTLEGLAQDTKQLLDAPKYSIADRWKFTTRVVEAILPLLKRKPESPKDTAFHLLLREMYAQDSSLINQRTRRLVAHVLKHKPSAFRAIAPFTYLGYSINHNTMRLASEDDGRIRLSVLMPILRFKVRFGVLGKVETLAKVHAIVADVRGTRDELIDYCLLRWWTDSELHMLGARAWHDIVVRIAGRDLGAQRADWLRWRMEETNQDDKKDWVFTCLDSTNPDIATATLFLTAWFDPKRVEPTLMRIASDRNRPADLRADVIPMIGYRDKKSALGILIDLLDDRTLAPTYAWTYYSQNMHGTTVSVDFLLSNWRPLTDPSFPFYDNAFARYARIGIEEHGPLARRIRDLAHEHLGQLTGANLPRDADAWRKWIEQHGR